MIAIFKYMEGYPKEGEQALPQRAGNKEMALNCSKADFDSVSESSFLTVEKVGQWNKLSREVVESL